MFSVSKKSLIIYQILAHLSLLIMIIYGSWQQWIISICLYVLISTIGGTITYHRLISHRSFNSPPWFEYIGTILASLGGNGSSITWAAIHREHHRYTDKEKDPHSPKYHSFFKIQFLSMLDKPNIRYVPDLLRSKFHLWIHQYYWIINIIYVTIIMILDPFAIIYAYFVPTLMVWHAGSLINTLNHTHGYRNYDTTDISTNNLITGYLVGGEGWHNNHHAMPSNPSFKKNWWEFDLGYFIINLVKKKV
jgi:stearoyl-CoA desaturase (delta-9 desaturase)